LSRAYPHQISGGQRQRVMIAMALALDPPLLIADEPTTALDVTTQAQILKLIKELQAKKGTGVLFITHDFGVVASMAHRLGVMREGRIVESGKLDDVLRRPRHAYTKQLLAALPDNLKKTRPAHIAGREATGAPTRAEQAESPLIEVRDLRVYFPIKKGLFRHTVDYVRAVDDVNLAIPTGQILALVGESGCGKTTIGRTILRLLDATSGQVKFRDEDVTRLPPKRLRPFRRQMQIIFQDPMSSLNPRLTIAATLTEPMAVHGIGENKEERLEMARRSRPQRGRSPGS